MEASALQNGLNPESSTRLVFLVASSHIQLLARGTALRKHPLVCHQLQITTFLYVNSQYSYRKSKSVIVDGMKTTAKDVMDKFLQVRLKPQIPSTTIKRKNEIKVFKRVLIYTL